MLQIHILFAGWLNMIHNSGKFALVIQSLLPKVRTSVMVCWKCMGFLHLGKNPRMQQNKAPNNSMGVLIPPDFYIQKTNPWGARCGLATTASIFHHGLQPAASFLSRVEIFSSLGFGHSGLLWRSKIDSLKLGFVEKSCDSKKPPTGPNEWTPNRGPRMGP